MNVMPIIVSDIKIDINKDEKYAFESALKKLRLKQSQIDDIYTVKVSIDARHKNKIQLVYSVGIKLSTPEKERQTAERLKNSNVRLQKNTELDLTKGSKKLDLRPVVIGFGPAGMFSALLLAQNGYAPIVFERGDDMDSRVNAVERFWKEGVLDERTNVQFGEGGAGTFSDGKLTTRINDDRCDFVMKELVKFGAPAEILKKAKPHIGTDKLRDVVKNIRKEIIALGGEVHFNRKLNDILFSDGKVSAVKVDDEIIETQTVILAIGHSARDTFEMLLNKQLLIQTKPFSVGVRIEHLQSDLDKSLFGEYAGHPALGKGEYQLSLRKGEDAVYTFCMCPGGFVVPSSSESGMVVTNGMSEFARDQKNANSALVVSVDNKDYGNTPMEAIDFQRELEKRAFLYGGENYSAPVQTVGRFLESKGGADFKNVTPSYKIGVTPSDFRKILPDKVCSMMCDGLNRFAGKISCFSDKYAVMTGVETRTSSPIRILRSENGQAIGIDGLYPTGEGAGYAGGIVSAAVDGIRAAQAVISEYSPK